MLRPYQETVISQIDPTANNLLVLPTGAGKTYTFTTYVKRRALPTCVMAHRCELVGQMSLALAELSIPHRVVASDQTIGEIMKAHKIVVGKSYYDPTADIICASVDTIIRRPNPALYGRVRQWVIDEAHHVLVENKWGKAVNMFPNASGLGVTATPLRADGKGLGKHADGVFTKLILGPTGDDLIDMGYLSPYRIAAPDVDDLHFEDVEIGSTGDYKQNQLRSATKASKQLVGSVVGNYLKFASGKLGITFCVDIEHAEKTAEQYKVAGVAAAVVTSKTPFLTRIKIMQDFKARKLQQLVNVDLFGEGTDVPAVEVVTQARKTASFGLYSQQVGRALRPVYAEGLPLRTPEERRHAIAVGPKPMALVIDHVHNVNQHLIPTAPRAWSLDRSERRSRSEIPEEFRLKNCGNPICLGAYPAYLLACKWCGWVPKPNSAAPASSPKEVDGDLHFVDMDALRALQAAADDVINGVTKPLPQGLPQSAHGRAFRLAAENAAGQKKLREAMALWAGYEVHTKKRELREAQKLFYARFGVDVMTAQTLKNTELASLIERVENDITSMAS